MTARPLPYPVVVLLLFALTALRLPSNFVYPSFWAEDGTVFFRQAIEIGPAVLLQPVQGSYHTVSRLLAFLATLFPVALTPAFYAAGAGLVSSASLALVARPGFRWLVPHDLVRVALAALFALVPGTTESYFALCGLNYTVFFGAALLLLERDGSGAWQMGTARTLLLCFLWFSLGQGLLLGPALLVLFLETRNRRYLLALAALGLAVALNLPSPNDYLPSAVPRVLELVQVYADNVVVRLFLVPVLGQGGVERAFAVPYGLLLGLGLVLVAGYVLAVRRRRLLDGSGARVLALVVLGTMAFYPLAALARNYGLGQLRAGHFQFAGRYSLPGSFFALLLLYLWLARPLPTRRLRIAGLAFLAWATVNVLFEPLYLGPTPARPFVWEWPQQAAALERALRAKRAGRLRVPFVSTAIKVRPGFVGWTIEDLTVTP